MRFFESAAGSATGSVGVLGSGAGFSVTVGSGADAVEGVGADAGADCPSWGTGSDARAGTAMLKKAAAPREHTHARNRTCMSSWVANLIPQVSPRHRRSRV